MEDRSLALGRLAEVVASSLVEGPLSLRMCLACVAILGVNGGSLTLGYGEPERVLLCATDEVAAQLEDLQEVLSQGPSHAAWDEGGIVSTAFDGMTDQRWPLFGEAAVKLMGAGAVYAIPIQPGPQTMGVATFYQRGQSTLLVDLDTSQFLVNAVGVALVNDPDVLDDDRFAKAESWANRARIHQATGMVMAQLGLGPEDALALVRAHAYAHDTTLSKISEDIVGWQLNFRTTDREPGSEPS